MTSICGSICKSLEGIRAIFSTARRSPRNRSAYLYLYVCEQKVNMGKQSSYFGPAVFPNSTCAHETWKRHLKCLLHRPS